MNFSTFLYFICMFVPCSASSRLGRIQSLHLPVASMTWSSLRDGVRSELRRNIIKKVKNSKSRKTDSQGSGGSLESVLKAGLKSAFWWPLKVSYPKPGRMIASLESKNTLEIVHKAKPIDSGNFSLHSLSEVFDKVFRQLTLKNYRLQTVLKSMYILQTQIIWNLSVFDWNPVKVS